MCGICDEQQGVVEFFSICPSCWAGMPPEERAVLQGKEPPVVEIRREFSNTYNPPNYFLRTVLTIWGVAVTAVLAWLVFKSRR